MSKAKKPKDNEQSSCLGEAITFLLGNKKLYFYHGESQSTMWNIYSIPSNFSSLISSISSLKELYSSSSDNLYSKTSLLLDFDLNLRFKKIKSRPFCCYHTNTWTCNNFSGINNFISPTSPSNITILATQYKIFPISIKLRTIFYHNIILFPIFTTW